MKKIITTSLFILAAIALLALSNASAAEELWVIGGGIAGMQSALLLAEKDHQVHVLESAPRAVKMLSRPITSHKTGRSLLPNH